MDETEKYLQLLLKRRETSAEDIKAQLEIYQHIKQHRPHRLKKNSIVKPSKSKEKVSQSTFVYLNMAKYNLATITSHSETIKHDLVARFEQYDLQKENIKVELVPLKGAVD